MNLVPILPTDSLSTSVIEYYIYIYRYIPDPPCGLECLFIVEI